ncbi:MAG: Septum formation protein Maf [bacterium ADurb.Bin431]|nr:MAG: Septum formation protein Maf [bacterium ADurb.Bin431]HNY90055.1 Maf family protein [bacterium]HOC26047.1 Maf family protein [bacterium]HOH05926.1 Maf family protein [bacterium]
MSFSLESHLPHRTCYLASQSPRRKQLLQLIGLKFHVLPSGIDEEACTERDPVAHVQKLALAKAEDVGRRIESGLVVGADTIVVLDGEILGKPVDEEDAVRMLRRLSGRTHQVYTGFAILFQPEDDKVTGYEVTNVRFRPLQEWEIRSYVATGSPMDKAGAYGIQDQSALFADRIEGCFYNVVGFPLTRFYLTLLNFIKEHAYE